MTSMDQETILLINAFSTCKTVLELALCSTLENPKNAKTSEDLRKEGNILFTDKRHSQELHAEILRLYNKSAATALNHSQQLACAYANRSAFLLHIGRYRECVQDVDKALEINKSDELRIKLLCRKVESLKNLGDTYHKHVLEEAQGLIKKINEVKTKKLLQKMLDKVVSLVVVEKAETSQNTHASVNLLVTDNVLEKVLIRQNEKYGRYLVAKQKYNPGDVIFVQKLLSTTIKANYHYTNCHHCLKICWTGIPCDRCDWAIFCSEDCKQRAWQEYHNMECSLGTLYYSVFDISWINVPCSKVIKIFIKAVKDAGSIESLRSQLEVVDQCTDVCYKGFYKDGKFNTNTIESFYSLTKRKCATLEEMINISRFVLITLVGLVKHPMMNIFQVKEVEDLIGNKDVLFLGSFLLKLTAIHMNNSFSFTHFLGIDEIQLGAPQDPRGSCVGSLASLLNNSCCPNANVCFTEDGKIILYALQFIEENDQIFTTYSREYYIRHLEDRKPDFENYSFECDCQACTESWPPVLLESYVMKCNGESYQFTEAEFVQQRSEILKIIDKDDHDEASLKVVAPRVTQGFNTLKQPTVFTCLLLETLNKCITSTYNGLQPQWYGVCKDLK